MATYNNANVGDTLLGQDVILQINLGDDYVAGSTIKSIDFKTIICETDDTKNMTLNSIDIANKCDPSASKAGNLTGTQDFTLQDLENVPADNKDIVTSQEMNAFFVSKNTFQWRKVKMVNGVATSRETFHGWLGTNNNTASVNTVVTTANTINITDTPIYEKNTGTADAPVWTVYDYTAVKAKYSAS